MSSPYNTNRNAIIRSRTLKNSNFRTETAQRDSGVRVSMTSTPSGTTMLSLTTENGLVSRLNGREARTLFRVLGRHFSEVDKSLYF